MANNLIPEELNALIQKYLTDGVLTDKERQVILNKAEKLGLDRDEIDLFLDAEVQKIEQATDAAARRQKGKQCPYCGGSVPQLTDKCPHCGEYITVEASNEIQEIFDNLEEALIDLKSGIDLAKSKANIERYARKARMYYEHNPKVQRLLSDIEKETIDAENRGKANARKSAIIQVILNHKKLLILTIVVLAVFLSIKRCSNNIDREKAEAKEQLGQQYELDKPKIDAQYDSLYRSLNELKTPNKSNYQEMTQKLMKIVWTDISKHTRVKDSWNGDLFVYNTYEVDQKRAFVELKRLYAEQLKEVYKKIYGDSYYNYTPEFVKDPSKIKK